MPLRDHARAPLLAAAAIVAVLPATADAKPLTRGARGKAVKRLQRALHIPADGVFGPGTTRALKRFQRRHDLVADGVVGAATWRMIRRVRARRASASGVVTTASGARVASNGPAVRLAQRRLGIEADGIFGPGTKGAVKRFQRSRGMTADGIVGPATWAALGVRGRHPVLKRRGSRRSSAGGGVPRAVWTAIRAANRIARFPYRYGGGHGSFNDTGYDCSGSVSYVLHAIGRLSRPRNSSGLMSYGAPGPGRWITVYAHPGHTYMVINGRRYDTTGRWETGSRWQLRDRSSVGYTVRHPPGF